MEFPAVTICPVAPVNCHRLSNRIVDCESKATHCSLDTLISLCSIYHLGDCRLAVRSGLQINRGFTVRDANCSAVDRESFAFLQDLEQNQAIDFSEAFFTDFLWRLSAEDRIAIATGSEYSMAGCRFRGNREDSLCQERNIVQVVSTSVGVCFSYNYFPPGEEGSDSWREVSFLKSFSFVFFAN